MKRPSGSVKHVPKPFRQACLGTPQRLTKSCCDSWDFSIHCWLATGDDSPTDKILATFILESASWAAAFIESARESRSSPNSPPSLHLKQRLNRKSR